METSSSWWPDCEKGGEYHVTTYQHYHQHHSTTDMSADMKVDSRYRREVMLYHPNTKKKMLYYVHTATSQSNQSPSIASL